MRKVAYIQMPIDGSQWTIAKGAMFIVDDDDPNILCGFWQGGTDTFERVCMQYDWQWKDAVRYYTVPDNCLRCKYCIFHPDGWECGESGCVLTK